MSLRSEILADSPLWFLDLQETSGTTAADSGSAGKNGTATNGATLGTASVVPAESGDKSASFDGVNDYLTTIAFALGLTDVNALTIEFVFQPTDVSTAARQTVVYLGAGTSAGPWVEIGHATGAVTVAKSGSFIAETTTGVITSGAKQHVVYKRTGSGAGTHHFIINGVEVGLTTDGSGGFSDSSAAKLVGLRATTPTQPYAGKISHLAVYNGALSDARIATHYLAFLRVAVPIGQPAETDTAQPITARKTVHLGQAVETDTAQSITAATSGVELVPVGQPAETDTAQPITARKTVHLGQAVETDTAQSVGAPKSVPIGQAEETDTAIAVAIGTRTELASWTLEQSQSATRRRTGHGSVSLDVAVAPIPDGVRAPFWKRVSPTMPTPVIASVKTGRPDPAVFTPDSVYRSVVGRPQTVVGGRDISFFRGFPVSPGWVDSKPFGPESASIPLQQISTLDELGTGDLSWCTEGAKVVIRQVDENGDPEHDPLFEGTVVTPRRRHLNRGSGLTLEVQGILRGAAQSMNQPHFNIAERDIGHVIANKFNQVVSRKFGVARRKSTGILTLKRGSRDDTVLGHAQDLLATATIADGSNAWTVACNLPGGHPVIRLSDLSTDHWVITNGTPGITVELAPQLLARANVIYGAGTAPDGCHWGGLRFPNLHDDVSPDYPFASPSTVMSVGTTDADTLDGDGVSKWQRRMISLGYDVDIDGVYGSADAAECRRIQAARGILVDGIVGPQTWVTTFAIGSNVGDLSGAFFMPLAYDPRVMPRLYHPDGSDAGDNPDYDESIPRIERFINFGENVKKHEGIRAAEALLARNALPDLSGTVTFTGCDPENGHRRRIRSGQNIRIKHFEGGPVRVHISRVEVEPGGRVTATVDTQFRDLLDLASIAQRRRENSDPARRDGTGRRRSALTDDTIVIWDCENGAGVIPRIPVYSHLPVVVRIPAGQQGQIAKIRLAVGSGPFRNEEYRRRDDVPGAARFAFAISSDEIDPAQIMRIIGGSPLNSERPWTPGYYPLTDAGVFYAVGSSLQAGGYSPGAQDQGDPITGRLIDDAGITYESWQPPWLWCLIVADRSGWAEGRLYPGVQDL